MKFKNTYYSAIFAVIFDSNLLDKLYSDNLFIFNLSA